MKEIQSFGFGWAILITVAVIFFAYKAYKFYKDWRG